MTISGFYLISFQLSDNLLLSSSTELILKPTKKIAPIVDHYYYLVSPYKPIKFFLFFLSGYFLGSLCVGAKDEGSRSGDRHSPRHGPGDMTAEL